MAITFSCSNTIYKNEQNKIFIMGSSISRIDDEYNCYLSFCEKLGEKAKDYEDIQTHTKELINKYGITKSLWWFHNNT